MPKRFLTTSMAKKQTVLLDTPKSKAPTGLVNPDKGVMAAKPAITPVTIPIREVRR